jgi:hypothetical protein
MSQGIVYEEPLLGLTLPEHGLGRRAVHVPSPAYLCCASQGSGKLLTSLCHHLIGWPSDQVVISPKEDLCNFALGRRSDPSMFQQLDLVRKYGRRLGVDPSGITAVTRHLTHGRVMNVDCGCQTAFPRSRYTFLSDVKVREPQAMARLSAIASGLFQRSAGEKDPYWTLAARGAYMGTCGHILSTEPDPANHNLVFATQRLMGIDPATGKSHPKLRQRLFQEMTLNPHLGGYIAGQGAELLSLEERTLGNLMSTVGNGTRWMLGDPRMRSMLTGQSDFSLDEVGRGKTPLTIFVTPIRGDESSEAFLRVFLQLALFVWQERDWTPERPIALVADEVPNWGTDQVQTLAKSLNILRDKRVVSFIYAQTLAQFVTILGVSGLQEMLSATTLQAFGVRDATTLEILRDRLGQTTVKSARGMGTVWVADTDAIYDELAPSSPLTYVFPYQSGRAMRLARAAFVDTHTREGLHAPAIDYRGHFDAGLPAYSARGPRVSP